MSVQQCLTAATLVLFYPIEYVPNCKHNHLVFLSSLKLILMCMDVYVNKFRSRMGLLFHVT